MRIQAKPKDQEILIVIDPYKPIEGSFPRSFTPHIVLYTRGADGSAPLSGDPFILGTPGECETKDVLISAGCGADDGRLFFRLDTEGISIGHLGRTDREFTSAQLNIVSGVDILCLPVGGDGCFEAEAAVKAVNAIEPKIIIPVAFRSDNDPKAGDVQAFLREMGAASASPEAKLIIKKKDLPQEETKVIVLVKE